MDIHASIDAAKEGLQTCMVDGTAKTLYHPAVAKDSHGIEIRSMNGGGCAIFGRDRHKKAG